MNLPSLDIHDPVNHTLEGFRSYLLAIPDDQWCSGVYANDDGQRCAQGHVCHRSSEIDEMGYPVLKGSDAILALRELFQPLSQNAFLQTVGQVNNGDHPSYQQPTPRARILAALDDLIALRDAKQAAALDAVERRPLVGLDQPVALSAS